MKRPDKEKETSSEGRCAARDEQRGAEIIKEQQLTRNEKHHIVPKSSHLVVLLSITFEGVLT